jgi:hypothetical protein
MMRAAETYFEHHFGKWLGRSEYPSTDSGQPSTWVYEWPRPELGITTFTTVGYSAIDLPAMSAAHHVEFMLSARKIEFDAAADILLSACEAPLDDGLPIQLGHTVGPLSQPIGAGMSRLLLVAPWEPEPFGTIDIGAKHAQVLMIVPIYESEFRLLRRTDEASFWAGFKNSAVEITNLNRSPVALSLTDDGP